MANYISTTFGQPGESYRDMQLWKYVCFKQVRDISNTNVFFTVTLLFRHLIESQCYWHQLRWNSSTLCSAPKDLCRNPASLDLPYLLSDSSREYMFSSELLFTDPLLVMVSLHFVSKNWNLLSSRGRFFFFCHIYLRFASRNFDMLVPTSNIFSFSWTVL